MTYKATVRYLQQWKVRKILFGKQREISSFLYHWYKTLILLLYYLLLSQKEVLKSKFWKSIFKSLTIHSKSPVQQVLGCPYNSTHDRKSPATIFIFFISFVQQLWLQISIILTPGWLIKVSSQNTKSYLKKLWLTDFWHRIRKTIYDEAVKETKIPQRIFGGNASVLVLCNLFIWQKILKAFFWTVSFD